MVPRILLDTINDCDAHSLHYEMESFGKAGFPALDF